MASGGAWVKSGEAFNSPAGFCWKHFPHLTSCPWYVSLKGADLLFSHSWIGSVPLATLNCWQGSPRLVR